MATAKLQVLSDGALRGATFTLADDSYSIGRADGRDIRIADSTVSSFHATLFQKDENVYILRDEGSTNGTRVNGKTLPESEEIRLNQGDLIQFGSIEVLFDQGDGARAMENAKTVPVINLTNTQTIEMTPTQLVNMGRNVQMKRPVILRENKLQTAVFLTLSCILGVCAVILIVQLLMK